MKWRVLFGLLLFLTACASTTTQTVVSDERKVKPSTWELLFFKATPIVL